MAATRRTGLSGAHRWLLVLSCLAVSLVIASMAALYTALPEIAADTGATQAELTWIVDGYTLALACLVLPAGALGDRYGRRAALIAGLLIFALASGLPLLLDSPLWLIISRALTGVGAALVMPSTLSLLTAGFPPERRNGAIGLWAGVVGAGAILGILGSGLLLEYGSWPWIFAGTALAGLVLSAASFTLPESADEARPAFDPLGAVSGALAVGAIVIAAIEIPARGWFDPLVLGALVVAAVSACAFVAVELRVRQPLLDVRLFLDRGFGSGTAIIAVQFLVGFGMFMLMVQYLQLILGYRPLISALAMAPMMVPMIAVSAVAPWLAERVGLRWPTAGGLVLIGISMFGLATVRTDTTYVELLWPFLVMSTGIGLCASPATAAIIGGTPPEKHGVAAAVNDAAREIGAAVGIAICGSVLAAGYSQRIAPALDHVPEQARGPVGDSLAAALEVVDQVGPAARPLGVLAEDAFVYGLHRASITLGVLTLACAVLIAVWAPGRRPREVDLARAEPVPSTGAR
ncbi:MFS transporter [Nocardia takedensis]